MDTHHTATPAIRHDGWTAERKALFLDALADHGNVLRACAAAGLSREAAYRLRRRDALFARAWAAAQVLAREHTGQVLGDRALEGVEEEVWYRGEVVGTRRRYDNRLLLAHIARLDKLAEGDEQACEDAECFDALIARVAGLELPDELAHDGDLLLSREECAGEAAREAEYEAQCAALDAGREDDEAECVAAYRRGRVEAEALWDAWHARACETVDGLLNPRAPGTLSTLSTSPVACRAAPAEEALIAA